MARIELLTAILLAAVVIVLSGLVPRYEVSVIRTYTGSEAVMRFDRWGGTVEISTLRQPRAWMLAGPDTQAATVNADLRRLSRYG